jgi:hypothetical protein
MNMSVPETSTYEILTDRNIVIERFRGKVGLVEFQAMVEEVIRDPRSHPEMDGIADFTNAVLDLSFEQMMEFVDYLSQREGTSTGRWAFVVTKPLNLGMAKMFQGLTEGETAVECFQSEREALQWLDGAHAPSSQ